jgi:hypothetical protein
MKIVSRTVNEFLLLCAQQLGHCRSEEVGSKATLVTRWCWCQIHVDKRDAIFWSNSVARRDRGWLLSDWKSNEPVISSSNRIGHLDSVIHGGWRIRWFKTKRHEYQILLVSIYMRWWWWPLLLIRVSCWPLTGEDNFNSFSFARPMINNQDCTPPITAGHDSFNFNRFILIIFSRVWFGRPPFCNCFWLNVSCCWPV